MKHTFLALLMLPILNSEAQAVPIVNENVANSGVMTIYPDNLDPNRYYIAPNVVMIAKDPQGRPYFSYSEFTRSSGVKAGLMQMGLVPAYTREELDLAKSEILKRNPHAQFSGLPFIQSSLELTGELPELISNNKCNHAGGLIGQEQSCTLVLTRRGRYVFYDAIQRKTIFTTLQFNYEVFAVIRTADGTFKDQVIKHGIAVRLDGDQLSQFPELIKRK